MTGKPNQRNKFCRHKGRHMIATGTVLTLLLTGWARHRFKKANNRM